MSDHEWQMLTLVVLVVDVIVIAIALFQLRGDQPALIGGWM